MSTLTCEQVRELLPAGTAGEPAAALSRHLAGCAACRAEARLLDQVRAAAPEVPARLEARVLQAVRARPVRRLWGSPRQLALAATLAAAAIGGSLLVNSLGQGSPETAANDGARAAAAAPVLPVLEDPALYGGSVLPNLTEAELESLLKRMES